MTGKQKEAHPLIDITRPDVNAPERNRVYSSPIRVEINPGEGGTYTAKKLKIDFHPDGPFFEKGRDQGHFNQALPSGPHQLHTQGIWFDDNRTEKSEWVFIEWFYVLTPPE
jgi:hypothetical protein